MNETEAILAAALIATATVWAIGTVMDYIWPRKKTR